MINPKVGDDDMPLAATIAALRDIVTTDYESKDAFIGRVRALLSADPDKRYQDALKRAYIDGVNSRVNAADEVIKDVAHRECRVYKHVGDGDGPTYTFDDHTLRNFVRQLVNRGVL